MTTIAIIGTAWIRVKVLSNKLGDDIAKSVEKSFDSASDSIDKSAERVGKKAGDNVGSSIADGLDKKSAAIGDSIDRNVGDKVKKSVDDALASGKDKTVTINADADTAKARAKLALAARTRTAKIKAEIDKKTLAGVGAALARLSGGRVLTDYFNKAKTALLNLDKSAPKLAGIVTAVLTLSTVLLSAISNASVLASNLVAIGGAGLALPGLFAGAAAGVAVLVMALKDTGVVLKDLAAKFITIQDKVSASFWKQAEDPIRSLAKKALPMLSTGLSTIGSRFGSLAGEFAKTLSSSKAMSGIKTILDNTAKSVGMAKNGVKDWTAGFGQLATIGSAYLPKLITWLNELGARFNDWVSQNAANGNIFTWIDNAIFQAQELWRALKNMWGVLGGIADAAKAAGGSTLTMLADGLGRVSEAINSVAGQQALTTLFASAHAAMQALEPGIAAVGDAFLRIVPVLTTLLPTAATAASQALSIIATIIGSPAFTSGISALVDGFASGLAALAPAAAPAAEALGAIGEVAGKLLANLGPVLGAAISALSPVIVSLGAALGPVIDMLGPALTSVISMLQPLLDALGPIFMDISAAVQNLITQVMPVVDMVLPGLVAILTVVIQFLGSALVDTINGLASVFQGVFQFIMGIVTAFQAAFQGNWDGFWAGIGSAFSGLWTAIVGAFQVFLNVGILGVAGKGLALLKSLWSGGWTAVKGIFTNAFNALKTSVTTWISNTVSLFAGLPGKIVTALSNMLNLIKSTFKGALDAGKGAVQAGIDTILGIFRKLGGNIASAVGDLGSKLYSAGKDVIQGMINGVKAMAGSLVNAAKSVVDNAINAAKNLLGIKSPSKVFYAIGVQTGRGLELGLGKMEGAIASAGRSLAEAAVPKIPAFDLAGAGAGAVDTRGGAGAGGVFNFYEGAITFSAADLDGIRSIEGFLDLLNVRINKR